MKKLKRSTKDYGGGGGRGVFSNELFDVTHWTHHSGKRTTLRSNLCNFSSLELQFDGWVDLKSNNACMVQFNASEIMKMVKAQKKISFKSGQESKAKQIREALFIDDIY